MHPADFYFYIGVLLAFPPVVACIALVRCSRSAVLSGRQDSGRQRVGLRLLLMQALVPPLQLLPLMRSVTSVPSRLAGASILLLPVASLFLGSFSIYFLVRYSLGVARILLPSLNLMVLTCTAALLVGAGATA